MNEIPAIDFNNQAVVLQVTPGGVVSIQQQNQIADRLEVTAIAPCIPWWLLTSIHLTLIPSLPFRSLALHLPPEGLYPSLQSHVCRLLSKRHNVCGSQTLSHPILSGGSHC